MGNPTIYRYPKQVIHNPDGSHLQIERSLRQNGDVSIIVKVKDDTGHHLVLYHLVYDKAGNRVHGPHEIPGSRDPSYQGSLALEIAREP
jgi:hypothetical protein